MFLKKSSFPFGCGGDYAVAIGRHVAARDFKYVKGDDVMEFRSHYDGKKTPVYLKCGPSLTQQHFKDECDINNIIRMYEKTGSLVDPRLVQSGRQPIFGDFTGEHLMDYQSAQNMIVKGRELFDRLPSEIRQKFGNNPAVFFDFCADSRNRDALVQMGLVDAGDVDVVGDKGVQSDNKADSSESSPKNPSEVG